MPTTCRPVWVGSSRWAWARPRGLPTSMPNSSAITYGTARDSIGPRSRGPQRMAFPSFLPPFHRRSCCSSDGWRFSMNWCAVGSTHRRSRPARRDRGLCRISSSSWVARLDLRRRDCRHRGRRRHHEAGARPLTRPRRRSADHSGSASNSARAASLAARSASETVGHDNPRAPMVSTRIVAVIACITRL